MRTRQMNGMIAGALALVLLAGCAGSGAGSATQHAQASPKRIENALAMQEVAPQRLSSGQCALVLWTKTQPPRRVLVAFNDPSVARVKIGGKTLDLPQTARGGELVFGHTPRQSFEGEGIGMAFNLEFDTQSGLVGGALAPAGTLEYRTRKGWSSITAVAGIIGCAP